MFESVTDGITVSDMDGKIVQMNEAVVRMHGYNSKAELIGRSAFELIAEKDHARAMENMKRTLDDGFLKNMEYTFLTRNGSEFPAGLSSAVIRDTSGELTGFIAVTKDITERKRAEEELREERDKVRRYLNVADVMLVSIDGNQEVSLINRKGCELLGCKEERVIGRNWFDNFIPRRVRNEALSIYYKLMNGENNSIEYSESPVLTKSAGETFIVWHNAVLTDEAGKIVGVLYSGEDITERRLLQSKMAEYQELDILKTNLLSTVSHELRTPLTIIKGYSTMLLDYDWRLDAGEKSGHLRLIDRATDRLTDLVDHLLDMSRLDAGLLKLEKLPVNISKLLKNAVAEAELGEHKRRIQLRIDGKLPGVNIDARRIREVLDNLIDNAIKYSDEGSGVLIEAKADESELVISVVDRGIGIAAEDLEKVFDRMYRIEQRLSADPGGMGLGLALCKALVEEHNGRIWVESRVGEGSTFYFTLPLIIEEGNNGEKHSSE